MNERVEAMKNEGVYVKVVFDSQYTRGNYTFQSITVLGNPKLLGVEFQLERRLWIFATESDNSQSNLSIKSVFYR